MFQFPGFPSSAYWFSRWYMVLHHMRSRIRISTDQGLFAAPRGLSQLITSFVGSRCQGILHMLFFAWTTFRILSSQYRLFSSCLNCCDHTYSYLSFFSNSSLQQNCFILPASDSRKNLISLGFLVEHIRSTIPFHLSFSLYFVCHVWKQISLFRLFGFQWTLLF